MSIQDNQKYHRMVKAQQHLNHLERNLALEKIKKRKADTRRKIELGGLVVKSKMDQYPKDMILGALFLAFESLEQEEGISGLYAKKGQVVFLG